MASGDNVDAIQVAETSFNMRNHDDKLNMEGEESDDDDKEKSGIPPPLDLSAAAKDASSGPKTPTGTGISRNKSDRERKIGHRRVLVGGEITYKKIVTTQIMGSIQLGIQHAVGGLASKPERDLLMQDFMTVETTNFPSEGSNHTPAHHYSEFRFRTYAPIAFRYFRDLFGIQPDDFLISMCSSPLRELSNPGASGSIFYLTEDDEFIIKTVQHKEGEFLQKLLPGYYMNLNQNPRTLLPKFFGLYCYQCNSKNVRLIAMNNLLPSTVRLHQKYDLKGSTYKRKASKSERVKKSPTYKDLDFMEHHPEGIGLEGDTYSALVKTIQRDCMVLESFKIMDYSLLVGVHNLDQAAREKAERRSQRMDSISEEGDDSDRAGGAVALNRSKSINRQRLVAHSTAMESIQAESEPIDEEDDVPPGGIPARNSRGERLLLFVGVIDILQSYRLKKKLEHTWKAMIHDGDTVSVHRPGFYAQRFQEFMAKTVFKKIPSPLKHSPSKRKSISSRPARQQDLDEHAGQSSSSKPVSPTGAGQSAAGTSSKSDHPPPYHAKDANPKEPSFPSILAKDIGHKDTVFHTVKSAMGASRDASKDSGPSFPAVLNKDRCKIPPPVPPRGTSPGGLRHRDKGLPCSSTPPPAFEDALRGDLLESAGSIRGHHHRPLRATFETVSVSEVRLECRPDANKSSSLSVESCSSGFGSAPVNRNLTWTPPASVEGSTPTWTEGTPSFTESSSSGDIGERFNGCPTTPVRALHSRRSSDGPKALEMDDNFESESVTSIATARYRSVITVTIDR